MITVQYERGYGGITLTQDQYNELMVIFNTQNNSFEDNESALGLGVPIYQLILEFISDEVVVGTTPSEGIPGGSTPPGSPIYGFVPKDGVDPAVWRWIEGAAGVNSGTGFFADFIREYTKIQFELRGGNSSLAEAYNQEASNRIALNLGLDILDNAGQLPGILGLGAIDAGAAASAVFGKLPGGENDYAPWAGSLLFPYLGLDNFFSDLLLNADQVSAEIGGDPAKIIKYNEGTYDLVAMLQAAQIAGENAGWANIPDAIINLIAPDVIDRNQNNLVAAANNFFADYYDLAPGDFTPGDDLVFNRWTSAWNNYFPSFNYQVGKYSDDTLVAEDFDTRAVINGGRGNDHLTGGSKNDLLDGDEGSDELFGSDGNDLLWGGKGNDYLNGGRDNDRLVGGEDNDYLNGGAGIDFLEGGIGNDTLDGGADNDILEGGDGFDTYRFENNFGFDTIKDLDGTGSIVINNQTVGEVKLVDGADIIYRDADEQFEALLINEGTTTSLLITALDETGGRIMIKDWQDGELGIVLGEGETPAPGNVGTVTGDAGNNAITLDNLRDNNPSLDLSIFTALHADGGAGNDILMGRLHGNDTLLGGEGDDIISGGFTGTLGENAASQFQAMASTPGHDHIDGGAGKDVIFASLGGGVAHGGADDDILLSTGPAYFQFNNLDALDADSEAGIIGHGAINRDQVLADVFPFLELGIEQQGDNYSLITRYFNDFTDDYQAYASQIDGLNFIGRLGDTGSDHSAGNVGYSFPGSYTFTYDYSTADGLTPKTGSNPRAVNIAISTFEPGEGYTYEDFANIKGANLLGDGGNDFVAGGMYADYLSGGADQDTLFGGEGNDVLDGGSEDDVLFGGGGIDILIGGAGEDTLSGDEQDDVLFGGDGDDQLHGGDGNDYLDGGSGKSYLYGGVGVDTLTAGPGYFYMDGGEGDDTYLVGSGITNDPDTGAVSVINDNKGNNTLAIMGVTDFSTWAAAA